METETIDKLYVYECRSHHRIARRDDRNVAPCSRCENTAGFTLVGVCERKEGESAAAHHVRALMMRKPLLN